MISFEVLKLTGALAAVWMAIGVVLVARMLPGYSHRDCVMSELGAVGRPTARIHPIVNNYPLCVLFIAFGISIIADYEGSASTLAVGILIIVHGVSHAVTGLFPCDEDLGIPKPSATQKVHNGAGLIMFLSLLAAAGLSGLSSSVVASDWFSYFSLASVLFSVVFLILMARSFTSEHNLGLYQRLSYGALVFWVAMLSLLLYSDSVHDFTF